MKNFSTGELFKIWGYVALNSFGGATGQIAVIHKLVVEDKKIISEERFLHALNFCMLLPGPEAQQLATYMGWLMSKSKGGLIAGGLFILAGFFPILILSYIYVLFNDTSLVQGLFYGVKPAIIVIVLAALYRISRKSLKNIFHWSLASLSFFIIFFMNFPFPLVVIAAGTIGVLYGRFVECHEVEDFNSFEKPILKNTLITFFTWICIWFLPVISTLLIFGEDSTLHTLNLFFSKMSLVTFGGAYAALSYVAQQGVEVYGWLQGSEMLDGLALAESTPGPLIQVVQYVGFMGAYRFPGALDPLWSAFIGSFLTTWMTFAPCFLFIFTLAPYIEFIRGRKIFTDALTAITASVVGIIFNLSVWFVLNTLFVSTMNFNNSLFNFSYPDLSSIDIIALGLCLIAFFMQFKLKSSLFVTLGVSTILGVIIKSMM